MSEQGREGGHGPRIERGIQQPIEVIDQRGYVASNRTDIT